MCNYILQWFVELILYDLILITQNRLFGKVCLIDAPKFEFDLKALFLFLVVSKASIPNVVDHQLEKVGVTVHEYSSFDFLKLVSAREHGFQSTPLDVT